MIKRNELIIANALEDCKGAITRVLESKNGTEKSIIDFVVFSNPLEVH